MKHFVIVLTGILAALCATAQSPGVLTTGLITLNPAAHDECDGSCGITDM